MFVYQIINKINGKKYIGLTVRSISKRFTEHCVPSAKELFIDRAIQKYGKENFEVIQLRECCLEKQMKETEWYYIKMFNTLSPNGYNLTEGGDCPIFTEKARRNLGKAHQKLVLRISPLTGEEKIYTSLKETELDGFNSCQVSGCCKFPFSHKSHKGFKWEYLDKKHVKQLIPPIKKFNSGKFKKGQVSINTKKVKITDLKTNSEYFFNSTSLAAKYFNYSQYNTVSAYCKEEKIVNNLKFQFLSENENKENK